jgi:hypothetical protein
MTSNLLHMLSLLYDNFDSSVHNFESNIIIQIRRILDCKKKFLSGDIFKKGKFSTTPLLNTSYD